MTANLLLAALALVQAAPLAADPLAASFAGWHTGVEDDLGSADSRVKAVRTAGCVTTVTGEKGSWRLDWRTIETIALEDVFVFLKGPGVQLAIVADVRDAAGQAKLRGMWTAMRGLAARCAVGTLPRVPDEAGVTLP